LLDTIGDELTNTHAAGHFVADLLLKLGLTGTVIGFILMLLPIGEIDQFDPSLDAATAGRHERWYGGSPLHHAGRTGDQYPTETTVLPARFRPGQSDQPNVAVGQLPNRSTDKTTVKHRFFQQNNDQDVFTDLLFNTLLGFAFMFAIAFMLISTPEKAVTLRVRPRS